MNETDDLPAKVADRIYIGSIMTATDEKAINAVGINAIVNLSCRSYECKKPVLNINMPDSPVTTDQLDVYMAKFAIGVAAIETALSEGRTVLVHCAAGVNRSATLIGFYLIETGWTYEQAFSALSNANRIRDVPLLTNDSFKYMLKSHCAMKRALGQRKTTFNSLIRKKKEKNEKK